MKRDQSPSLQMHLGETVIDDVSAQVDCENLRRRIAELQGAEPQLGTACLRERIAALEAENGRMHERLADNAKLRTRAEVREAELAARCAVLGVAEESLARPGTAAARPRTGARPRTAAAAAEAIMDASSAAERTRTPLSEVEVRARNKALRQEIEKANQTLAELRAKACSTALGRALSPPPMGKASADRLGAASTQDKTSLDAGLNKHLLALWETEPGRPQPGEAAAPSSPSSAA